MITPDLTKPEWRAQKTYDQNRLDSVIKAMRPELTDEEKARPFAKYYYDEIPQPDPAHYALMDTPIDPKDAFYPEEINRLLDVDGLARHRDRLVHPAERRRLHRQQHLVSGGHRRDDRLVVRVASAGGPALPHLVSAAARRHHAQPHRPGPHPRSRRPHEREELGRHPLRHRELRLRLREHRHQLPDPGRPGLRHDQVRRRHRHLRRRHGLGCDCAEVRRLHHRSGAHGATSSTRKRAGCGTAPGSGWATASTSRTSPSSACLRVSPCPGGRQGLARHNVKEYTRWRDFLPRIYKELGPGMYC